MNSKRVTKKQKHIKQIKPYLTVNINVFLSFLRCLLLLFAAESLLVLDKALHNKSKQPTEPPKWNGGSQSSTPPLLKTHPPFYYLLK